MSKMSKGEALRRCINLFEGLKRMASKGGAGLEPQAGAETSFEIDCEILENLREMLRDMENGKMLDGTVVTPEPYTNDSHQELRDWQQEIMKNGPPELLVLRGSAEKADDEMENVSLEGSGSMWWYVTEACRREVSLLQKTCPSCGKKIRWDPLK